MDPSCPGHASQVVAVAYAELNGRPVAVTDGWDGSRTGPVRVLDLTTGSQLGDPMDA